MQIWLSQLIFFGIQYGEDVQGCIENYVLIIQKDKIGYLGNLGFFIDLIGMLVILDRGFDLFISVLIICFNVNSWYR